MVLNLALITIFWCDKFYQVNAQYCDIFHLHNSIYTEITVMSVIIIYDVSATT